MVVAFYYTYYNVSLHLPQFTACNSAFHAQHMLIHAVCDKFTCSSLLPSPCTNRGGGKYMPNTTALHLGIGCQCLCRKDGSMTIPAFPPVVAVRRDSHSHSPATEERLCLLPLAANWHCPLPCLTREEGRGREEVVGDGWGGMGGDARGWQAAFTA